MSGVADVQAHLTAASITGGAWPSVRRRMHDGSDQLVVISEAGGPAPETPAAVGIGSAAMGSPQVQVRTRGKPWDGDSAEAKATEILRELHGRQAITMNGTTYLMVTALTEEPVFMGFDEKARPEFTVTLALTRGVPAPAT